jgi:prevent-host-death family protein
MDASGGASNGEAETAPAGAVSIQEMRAELTAFVHRAAYGGERIPISRNGKVLAVLVSVADLDRLVAADAAA